MKIGLVSAECVNGDISHNVGQIIKYLKIAKSRKIDYIFFGESFLQGFDSLLWSYGVDKDTAKSKEDDLIRKVKDEAKKQDVGVGFGYFERANHSIYSSYLIVSKDGDDLINYRRISKGWKDNIKTDSHYKEGRTIKHFNIEGYPFSIALCGDLWDEETEYLFRNDFVIHSVLLWPVHVDFSLEEWNDQLKEYHNQAQLFSNHVCLVNNILKPNTHGGAFYFRGSSIEKLDFDLEGIRLVDLNK